MSKKFISILAVFFVLSTFSLTAFADYGDSIQCTASWPGWNYSVMQNGGTYTIAVSLHNSSSNVIKGDTVYRVPLLKDSQDSSLDALLPMYGRFTSLSYYAVNNAGNAMALSYFDNSQGKLLHFQTFSDVQPWEPIGVFYITLTLPAMPLNDFIPTGVVPTYSDPVLTEMGPGVSDGDIGSWAEIIADRLLAIQASLSDAGRIEDSVDDIQGTLGNIEADTEEMRSKIYWMAEDLKSMSYNILGAGASGESVNSLLAEIRNILKDVNGMGIEVDTSDLDAITDQIETDYDSYQGVEDDVIADFEGSVDVATDAASQWGNILKNGVHFTTIAAFVNGQFTDIWSVLGDYQLLIILPLLIGVVLIFTGRGGRVR